MSAFKILIVCCFVYQVMAGGPSNFCIPCREVFVNLAPLSPATCDHGSNDPIQITIVYKPEAGLPDAEGICVDMSFTDETNSLIESASAVAWGGVGICGVQKWTLNIFVVGVIEMLNKIIINI